MEFSALRREIHRVVKAQKNVAVESDSAMLLFQHILRKLFSCNKQTEPKPKLNQNRGH